MKNTSSVFVVPEREMVVHFWKWVGVVLSVFLVAYLSANHLAAQSAHRYEMYTDWELGIPLVPSMIIVYLSYVGVFLLLPFILKSTESLASLAYAFLFGILVSTTVFILFPGELGYARPEHVAGFDFLYQLLYQVDKPHNLYPSLHVTFSSLTAMVMAHQTKAKWFHFTVAGWAIVIALSVILVHQHHMFDIITGLMLAIASYRLVYLRYAPEIVEPEDAQIMVVQ